MHLRLRLACASPAPSGVESFAALEPRGYGFRNQICLGLASAVAKLLLAKAQRLTLTAPEMTVPVGSPGGCRAPRPGLHQGIH